MSAVSNWIEATNPKLIADAWQSSLPMFILKQFLKALLLPPMPWLLLLLAVLIFWQRRWARKLLFLTFLLILGLHCGPANYALRYPLEARYPPLLDPRKAGPYDAIVVLTSGSVPPTGLIPFSSVDEHMFRRLDEAWRLYRIQPKPIIISGGHVNPFTPAMDENRIARDFLIKIEKNCNALPAFADAAPEKQPDAE